VLVWLLKCRCINSWCANNIPATPSEVTYHTPEPKIHTPNDSSVNGSSRTEEEEIKYVSVAQTGSQFPGHQKSNDIALNEPDTQLPSIATQSGFSLAFSTQTQNRTVLGIPQENEFYIRNPPIRTSKSAMQMLSSDSDMRTNLANDESSQSGRRVLRRMGPKLESLLRTINGNEQGIHTNINQDPHLTPPGLPRMPTSVNHNSPTPDQHVQRHQVGVQVYGISNEALHEISSNARLIPGEGILVGQKAHTVSGGTIPDDEQDRRSTSTRSYARGVTYPGYAESEITGISLSEFFVTEVVSREMILDVDCMNCISPNDWDILRGVI
jgi:hypothetical protein